MIFIIGGNGFVGSAFRRYCEKNQLEHVVLTRQNYDNYVGKGCDILINSNGNSKKFFATKNPREEFMASVVSVMDSLRDFNFKTYVYLSTSDVYPDCSSQELTRENSEIDVEKQSIYGFHKYIAEQYVIHAAKEWLIVRQGGFVGQGMKKNAIFDILNTGKLWVNPESEFQFIRTDESADLVFQLLNKRVINEIVNLTAKGTIKLTQVAKILKKNIVYAGNDDPLRYEISTEKASKWLSLPSTIESVSDFLKDNIE